MEWYWLVLIIYLAIIFINVLIADFEDIGIKEFWSFIAYLFVVFVVMAFLTPILILDYVHEFLTDNRRQYEVFTIHKLTEANKKTLLDVGFKEADKGVSYHNIEYFGFRHYDLDFVVQNNGRCFVHYNRVLNRKQKEMIEFVKKLENPLKKIEKLEFKIKQNEDFIKDKKESKKRWASSYDQDIERLQKEIIEAQEQLEKLKGEQQ